MDNFTGSMDDPVAQRWNSSSIDFAEITMDRNFALLLVSLISAILWIVYITYYNSRVLGYILTRLINKFYFQDDNFKIGSFTLNALSGKIMFRDIVYINYDYTLRIQDGYLIFRWWRSYVPKDVSEDLSHSDTRLSIMLNGFELHFYNRCDLYNELEKLFGLEPVIKQQNDDDYTDRDKAMNDANEKRRRAQETVRSEAAMARTWRDLIPVIKIDICSGRVVFGNRLVPTTLSISVEESHLVYSTKPPASSLDHLMHFVKAKAENCKVMLAPSPNYTSMVDEPPRYMGEGFVVMSSNYIEVYFYMDEPGLVPEQPVLLQLANGDIVESAPPIWGVDIKCGKGTDFSYGPWADRQRDHLFKFFFPPNYKNLEVTPQPKPGDIRQTQSFDIRLSTLNEATIDILFTKNKETNAVHINIGAGSYLEVTLPWIVLQDGYTTKITGQLLHLEATTSLQYRSLAESETLEYTVKCHYPLVWNHHQCWQLSLTGCKATTHLVYTHIDFFQDLINDWSTKARPDILHFVPYTWKISLLLKECEVVTVSNQYNWIDCSSTNQENNHVAFCGDLLDVSFDLPFVDFLPDVIPLKIWVQGEAVDMSLYLPEVNTSKLLLLSLDKNMKLVPCRLKASKWRRKCVKSQGWVDCWSVPIVALSVRYNYHPIPPLGPEPQADITTPEKEEILLSPMRIPRMRKQPQINWALDGNNFDRTTLPPDKVSVELEVGPSILLAYGTIITSFMNLLENIFGEDQTFTDMQKSPNVETFYWSSENAKVNDKSSVNQHNEISIDDSTDSSKGPFDPRHYRPLDVTVSIIIHDIQAHLVKNCSESEPPCPVILIERFGFEMDKSFRETKLQLLLSPSILVSANNLSRSNPMNSGALYQGHLMLSSFQLRGNGFFSDTNRNVEEDTVEYAWMMELQLGQLTGRLTLPQLYQIISSLETFLLLICDSENELVPPNPAKQCHHGVNNVMCQETDLTLKYRCPTANEIKYKMIRVAIDLIDIYIADSNTTLQTWISPVRLSFCNLHGSGFGTGVTGLLPNIKLALYTQTNMQTNTHHHSNGSNNSQNKPPESDNWVGVGSVALGPLLIEAASSLPQTPKNLHLVQQKFLKLHDDKTKRLWFLWPVEGKSSQCGCTGGCAFFGSNRNGPNFLKPNPNDLNDGINVAMFNIIETTPGEYGYGQSLLHSGQLVFHTPPYNSLNVCLQPTNVATLIPSPLPQSLNKSPQSAERRSLTRRFSYTSMSKGSNNLLVSSTKSDVPYARLVDSSVPLGSTKIDSDSKLNKSILNVPQMESSVSDSKLALSCGVKDAKKPVPTEAEAFAVPKVPMRNVAVSESHYSLNSQVPPEDTLPQEVQRTMSITSENHSEAFFSADEDMFPSRSSSLKHSFGSRHSNPRDKSSFGINDITNEKWSAPKSEPVDIPDTISNLSTGVQPDSESGSVSSTSFISAISSQEDMTLVNLHMQTNKPIVDSPLLMASYMHNLPQYKCPNWGTCSLPSGSDVFTLPLFKRADDGTLVYVGQKYLPSFEPLGKINILRLVSKKDHNNQNQHGPYSNLPPHFNSQVKAHPYPQGWWDVQQTVQDSQENTTEKSTASTVTTTSDSKSGLFVKLRGEIDIMLTPLVLESTQKFVESLTPVLANIHPITVINHLRLLCISTVSSANVLKQKQYVQNWLPQMQDRSQSNLVSDKDDKCKLATIPHSNVYEESICESLQATVTIPKVNMIFIQSSVVEDMISFSALDNIQDLTCVSLFGVSVENIIAKYVSTRKNLESVQLYYRPTLRALGSKKSFGIMKGPRALISAQTSGKRRGPERGEPVYIEASQQQCEDTTITLNVGKVHGQLRRIRNESSQLKDVTITGIPCQHSKVSFKFIRVDSCAKGCESMCCQNGTAAEGQKDNPIGFIMFECGLEGISIKVSKHSQSHKPQAQAEEKKPLRPDNESCRESVKSAEESKPDKDRSTKSRTSGIEDLFRKRDSSSKPSTPNLGTAQPPPVPPPPEPSTPGPDEPSNNDSTATVVPLKDNGNTSSCAIDLKVVWFNFAAPPRTPITKKIDYTRLDWNLLSTASPAINAWMNPCNRLGIRVVALYRAYARRLTATAASLMAAALDLAPHHTLPKSRYGRHTPMAKQLREEPSLQLCAVLLRYALQADAAAVQADLAERHLPSLSTLRQGVIVLSRQWKNILYTPLLLEHNYKSKVMKPLNVTFALPDLLEDSVEGWQEYPLETEALDENCLLLNMDVDKVNVPAGGAAASPRPHSFPSTPPSVRGAQSSRASLVFPSLPFSTRKPVFNDDAIAIDYGTLKEDLPTVGSNPSLYSPHGSDENIKNDRAREDLYQWMAKQEPIKVEPKSKKPIIPPSKMNPRAVAAAMPACSLYPLQGSLMLLDAHLVFQPFLAALGVSPHQVTQGESKNKSGSGEGVNSGPPALDSLGSKLSLVAWMDMFRIDIVVSDLAARDRRHAGKGKSPQSHGAIPSETPAFLCEKVSIDVDLKKVADVAVDDLIQRQNVLYISRGQLKKHISTMLNFNISIRFISQQVNMPLLRLLHQISNMYQNVKDTQIELRTQTKISHRQNKHTSSSVSDFRENLVSVSSLEKEVQYATLEPKWDLMAPTLTPELAAAVPQSLSQQKLAQPTRPRPQSFAQKLRSTGKSVKGKLAGRSSLGAGSPGPGAPSAAPSPGGALPPELSSPSADAADGKLAPRCWRTVYLLLDLYANMPDAETITHRFSVTTDLPEQYRHSRPQRPSSREQNTSNSSSSAANMGMVVVGVARIHRTRLLASLSGLKLEAEITSLQASLSASRSRQWSLTGNLGRTMIVLLEGVAPNHQTVVRVSVGKSQALYGWEAGRPGATALLSVGGVRVDLPQHPVALHGVMTRSSRQLSSTLQELGVTRTSSRLSRTGPSGPSSGPTGTSGGAGGSGSSSEGSPAPAPRPPRVPRPPPAHPLLNPLHLHFSIVLQSLSVTAALLPSLQAQYKMEQVQSSGVTGNKAQFTVDLQQHSLSFVTKLQVAEVGAAKLPAEAAVWLPGVHVAGRVLEQRGAARRGGAVLRAGRYVAASADIGLFEHTLSTDLLNHLVFVQKVFMKEVNEVVQKVYGGEKPVPLWNEEEASTSALSRILFSLTIRIKRIQLTATTPSNSAVRLETGAVEFEISNRVQNVQQPTEPHEVRLFARAQVDVNLSLGQLIRNAMFEEAEPEFQQYAFFNTRISMRNAFQDEMVCGDDKEVVLITLKRPLIYIQPVAVDKAILVWLNYKNAYEYWNEKRLNLNKEVLTATQQVFEKVQLTSQITTPHLSTLFLQLNVDDIGICLPLNQPPMARWGLGRGAWGAWCGEGEARGAVVVTLESTHIGACSSGALVSKGRFVGLCLRFADDFEASLDDWKPRADEPSLNVCCVSEGTYEVCSRTTAAKHNENAKWFLNVSWQMEGVDIHLDVNVGKQLSALGHTLTMLTGYEEEDPLKMDYESDLDDEADNSKDSQESIILRRKYTDHLPAFVFDTSIDAKKRSKLIEKEMNEQAKIINDLRTLGASHTTIEYEMKRLHDLEALVFKDFRRDMIQKLRRQSVRASSITKGKLGLGSNRSKSFVVPSPPQERKDFEGAIEPNLTMSPGVGDSGETLLLGDEDNRLADIIEGGSWSSMESEPLTGPSRSASLRGPRACAGSARALSTAAVQRQSSLPAHPDHWPDELEGVELRRKPDINVTQSEGLSSEGKASKAKTAEPNIDFELDVKVYINSGKCVLHTKEPSKEDDSIKIGRMRVGRSASGGLAEGAAGVAGGAGTGMGVPGGSSSPPGARRKAAHARHVPVLDLTVFRVPGLDLKVHYESKTLPEEATSPQTIPPLPSLNVGPRKVGIKKAALFAWITLQSIPEETIISPHILEFLEQTLEPIPTKASFSTPTPEAESGSRSRSVEGASYGQYVYASFPVDVIVHFHMQPSTFRFSCLPASRVECLLQLPSLQIVFSSKRASDEEMAEPAVAMGGLSVTGCLADFSVNMFHPYGGKKSSLKEAQWSPLSDTERKDSLSINVEFVKFHLSRSRKLDFQTDQDQSKATVRFSTIVDVGSAWFKYDMRRLGEILAFPKAWYRRTIVRRMFLGDLSLHDTRDHGRPSSSNAPVSPVLPQREKTKTVDHQKSKDQASTKAGVAGAASVGAAWETLVLFAVNFTRLNVHMNMGNVMGNVSWQSRDFNCTGRLSIGSTGHRNMLVGVALAGSELDARGGIVGGAICLSSIDTYVHIEEEAGCNPGHVCGVRLAALELRLEYMGTPVLLARVSALRARATDEWLARHRGPAAHTTHPPTSSSHEEDNGPAIILTHGKLSWHQLQILMSRSTTPDLLKMQLKLEEFFTQQFKSSKRVFSSLHPNYTNARRDRREPPQPASAAGAEGAPGPSTAQPELRHHRHWQKVLQLVSGMQLSTLSTPLPANGTVLGGTMELHGTNISLACFHGNSFKAKSWALFSLKDPCISFATEAQQVASEDGPLEVHVVQSLTASLGSAGAGGAAARAHVSMATVCRMTRALLFPPQFKTLREWFHYAFANSEIDAIELFPSLEREPAPAAGGAAPGAERKPAADKHVREVIFALPSLQLHLRTHHLQANTPPTETDEKPVVECSFITEFEDHIFVSVDAEAFLFLHDLISSYIKEKDRVMPGATRGSWSESAGAGPSARARPEDYRDYRCVTWHLEPTVRLLSWAGKSIEPYGVDYILQKLGFSHARTTIPKWLQRGTLDPLDKLLSLVLLRLVAIVPHK
ncbi:transmembrane protein KIAA1109 homolog isoform X4 [Spodoptera frugiperda]|uniref:Transmembrane protein KIAA1109 homolog isoform X4 n=1 Tax=Spodoptera frugiperda TaxID=7108 RepID=A0A9R0DRJ9_SPOFR|nr:transmembrane protein KIAA1109 homolog isoform X4 [Spodoptera frugiperda]